MKGAAEKAAMGTPRSSFFHKSANVPPTSVMGAEKAMPSMVRQTSRVPMFLATAHGITKTMAMSSVEPLPHFCDVRYQEDTNKQTAMVTLTI